MSRAALFQASWRNVVTGVSGTLVAVIVGVASAAYGVAGAIGVPFLALLLLAPFAVLLVVLTFAQEVSPASASEHNPLASLGNAIFFDGRLGLSIVLLLVAVGVFSALLSRSRGEWDRSADNILMIFLLSVVLIFLSAVNLGIPPKALLLWHGSFVLIPAGFLIAAAAESQYGGARLAELSLGPAVAIVGAMAALAAVAFGIGHGVLYDSATPAIAASLAMALITKGNFRSWVHCGLLLCCVAVVLLSLRRNIWAAMALALFLNFIVSNARMKNVVQATVLGFVGLALIYTFAPSFAAAAIERALAADVLSGSDTDDASTAGHFSDIANGWDLAMDSPWRGYGPQHALPGLVVQEGRLYVHNDLLMAWLGFGVAGLVSFLLVVSIGIFLCFRVLRQPERSLAASCASFFLLIAPISGLSAAFLTGTMRWPVLYGLALGIACRSRSLQPLSFAATADKQEQ